MSKRTEIFLVLCLIGLYIFVRSINFGGHLNFSSEQAQFSTKALELWQTKKLELIGPPISFKIDGREIFQGSITYYFQWLFMLPANFDPLVGSYLMVIFGSLTTIPLYLGVKKMSGNNENSLWVTLFYCVFPIFVDYSRFFWNPNYQFLLTPVTIFLLASCYKKNSFFKTLFLGFWCGVLLMFHYQYILAIGILIAFLWISRKLNLSQFVAYLVGLGIGFSPLIFFELRHDFYNLRTIIFFFQKGGNIGGDSWTRPHYFISILLIIIAVLVSSKKVKMNHFLWAVNLFLLVICLFIYSPKPRHGFGMTENWNYETELKVVNKILENGCPKDFEVAETISNDTRAYDLRYLLELRKCKPMAVDQYPNSTVLYLITPKNRPPQTENVWEVTSLGNKIKYESSEINDKYKLWKIVKN